MINKNQYNEHYYGNYLGQIGSGLVAGQIRIYISHMSTTIQFISCTLSHYTSVLNIMEIIRQIEGEWDQDTLQTRFEP